MERTQIDYIVFEGEMARAERQNRRLWVALIVSILATIVTNLIWIGYISQYDFEEYEYEVSTRGGGNASYIGGDGEITYGTSESCEENTQEKEQQR